MPWTLRMTLLVTAITAVCFLYNTARFYWYSKQTGLYSRLRFGFIAVMAAILIFFYPFTGWLLHMAGVGFSTEWYPVWVIVLFWYGFIFNAVLVSWILSADLLNLILRYIFRIKRPQLQSVMGLLVVLVTSVVFVYTATKTIYDTNRIVVDNITLNHPAVEAGQLDPFRIVHISEMHADRYTTPPKMARYMQKAEEQQPDIIFFTGDLISSGMNYVEPAARALASFEPPLGTYVVIGDHDYWTGEDQITDILEQKSAHVVRDENEWVSPGNNSAATVKITGVTDIYSAAIDRDRLRDLLQERRNEEFRILFSHQAKDDLIEIAQDYNTDLLLAGHTHGGQVRIPFFFRMLTAASGETDYVIGDWQLGEMLLNINSGLGFTLGPLRYNAPAEITVIDVK